MKDFKLIPLFFLMFYTSSIFSQGDFDIDFSPKLFSLREARLSLGFGAELVYLLDSDDVANRAVYHSFSGSPESIKFDYDDDFPGVGYYLALDFYAPNSIIGFYSELKYSITKFKIKDNDDITDQYENSFFEIPFYLKLRPGKIESDHHLLIMAGGAYAFPLSVKHTVGNVVDEDIDQMRNYLSLGGMLGYEYYAGDLISRSRSTKSSLNDQARVIIYSRFNYRFQSPFNPNYGERVVATIDNDDLIFKDLAVTFGVSIFFKIK